MRRYAQPRLPASARATSWPRRALERRGLVGLIAWPHAEPVYLGAIVAAKRPPWCGDEDPREAALSEAYGFLIARAPAATGEIVRVVKR
jgi:hypothetical protein